MKIIQIGFNKCGTTSIDAFLRKAGFKTIHWDHGKIAKTIKSNVENSLPPLEGYEEYDCLSDMEFVTNNEFIYAFMDYYQEIDKYYDDVYFILNIRPYEKWIKSRLLHNSGTYLSRFISIRQSDEEGVISFWKNLWDKHLMGVCRYFKNKNNCLVFDIENDSGATLCKFLGLDENLSVNYRHLHKTSDVMKDVI